MGPRTRRFIAAIGALAFLAFYVWAVVAIGDRLPESMWIDLVFYGVAGLAWGAPLIPLLGWAERGRYARLLPGTISPDIGKAVVVVGSERGLARLMPLGRVQPGLER